MRGGVGGGGRCWGRMGQVGLGWGQGVGGEGMRGEYVG